MMAWGALSWLATGGGSARSLLWCAFSFISCRNGRFLLSLGLLLHCLVRLSLFFVWLLLAGKAREYEMNFKLLIRCMSESFRLMV